jgi:hypothetical protein
MKYTDGRPIAVGDRVKLWEGQYGTVVCSIDTGEFTPQYARKDWDYLERGVLIESDNLELFHYTEHDEDFEFVSSRGVP